MKILFIHNFHRDGSSSGDDVVVNNEVELLRKKGHDVDVFTRFNSEVDNANIVRKFSLLAQIPWSLESAGNLNRFIKNKKYDVAHIHTWFPLISPSVYGVLHNNNIPIVQTLHDFRFFCPVAFLFRNGEICEECPEKGLNMAIKNRCFQNSFLKSFLAVETLNVVKYANVFDKISKFIVFTKFDKKKFVELGVPESKIAIKPHFLPDSQISIGIRNDNNKFFLYLGRLSKEKGIDFLLDTWTNMPYNLKIIGSGDYKSRVEEYSQKYKNIEYLGFVEHSEIYNYLRDAYAIIMPSVWYETFGMVIMESYSVGTPVIASKLGVMEDMVDDGKTGFLFKLKDKKDFSGKVAKLYEDNELRDYMSSNALLKFKELFNEKNNYDLLMDIYKSVL